MPTESKETNIQMANEKPETDTIDTQQIEKQKVKSVNNDIAEKGEKQKTKGCFKKSKEISEFKKMANLLTISSYGGMAINALVFANSIVDIIEGEKNISSHLNAFFSLGGFCENLICFIPAVIRLSKFKQNNKEIRTETMSKNNKNTLKKSNKIQNEMISKEEDKQTKPEIEIQKSQNQAEITTLLNSELEGTFNLSKKSKKQQKSQGYSIIE